MISLFKKTSLWCCLSDTKLIHINNSQHDEGVQKLYTINKGPTLKKKKKKVKMNARCNT